jgi:hypothetical protein
MPINIHVFVHRGRIPTAAQWAQEIRQRGFATQLPGDFDPLSCSGYLPCPDDRTGFELYVEPFSRSSIELSAAALPVVGDRDTLLTFRLSGREVDLEAAKAAAASLAAMSDGVVFDEESGHFVDAQTALAWARAQEYRPVAVRRLRASRRRSRFRWSSAFRLLLVLAFAATVLYFLR